MRSIPLKKLESIVAGQTIEFDYKDVIKTMLEAGNGEGFTLDQVRHSVTILNALDKADEVLVLEEAEWSILCSAVQGFKWRLATPSVVEFSDDVIGAKKEEANEKVRKLA